MLHLKKKNISDSLRSSGHLFFALKLYFRHQRKIWV